ncbi:uncharacterized protein BCR38DRAFT_340427 [Pseudomassariella vexata]|uniref:DNA polymerase n=1 Tax=Pseudomassariella vexata TaxID=1141098 RepID=A0A1Y2E309_9PEZI|nr:uncharacterized protein BCR38DRAFT_340427 [Pseudomassariella vexata]ORY65941.1 hypothetical protein BCR38DRAFT_340427 [Pseudomassariella vexata]
MIKRKRGGPAFQLVPEAQRCFTGLHFYYIPNDDVNPVRKARIKKAKEHGATWTRGLETATHVIVDKQFTYADIESTLAKAACTTDKIIVNETYPLDCQGYHALVNPDQPHYKVPGFPLADTPQASTSETPADLPGQSQTSEQSLELKPRRNAPLTRAYVPPRATPERNCGSQRSPEPRATQVIPSSLQGKRHNPASPEPDDRAASAKHQSSNSSPPGPEDELTKYMKLARDHFSDFILDDEEEVLATVDGGAETGSSDEERQNKKQRSTKKPVKYADNDVSWQDKFACMKGGTEGSKDSDSPNARTIEVLQSMCDYYSRVNDHWRVNAYRKGIATLRRLNWKVTTYEEAFPLPDIGHRLAQKIEEIATTNRLLRLEYAQQDSVAEVLDQFLKIYGVGLSQANKWISQGFRTIEDLKKQANLTINQRVGIEHYEDLNTRIPRQEVQALGDCVKRAAAAIDPAVELLIGGSYRRGSESSGDIDFIITKTGTTSTDELVPFLDKLVRKLGDDGFLTCTLAALRHSETKSQGSKWHGCCVLPQSDFPGKTDEHRPIWRRIDLLLVPETEFGAAVIYFTGNDIFNRSMRLLASKKGMRLNQRGLYKDVMRGFDRVKLSEGQLIEGKDEEKIFEILGVTWREPHERWC